MRKLKNLIINPKYQAKYVFWVSSTGMILVVVNALVFYSRVKENYSILVELSPMTDEAKTQLYSELNQIVVQLFGISAVFLLMVGIVGLVFSHRTAGPMYHFKRVFKLIQEGKTDARVRLRPSDDFHDVADGFNAMMDERFPGGKS